jgi:hypothetical protein
MMRAEYESVLRGALLDHIRGAVGELFHEISIGLPEDHAQELFAEKINKLRRAYTEAMASFKSEEAIL